jgi:hypothetical protein
MNVLAGCDFFTVEVLGWRGLVTYYVLFFLHLESRRVHIAGITRHPDQEWMEQIGHCATQETWGYLYPCRCEKEGLKAFLQKLIGVIGVQESEGGGNAGV